MIEILDLLGILFILWMLGQQQPDRFRVGTGSCRSAARNAPVQQRGQVTPDE
ncbi:hypothetical protein AQF52_0221 [Streptomyces venezuelae]|nr:hypothetical protein AQF52_0221 [Streptomyces venezuelae]CUM43971.1 hypothetical protein BN2537_16907 [Streptomyces venezuelae]